MLFRLSSPLLTETFMVHNVKGYYPRTVCPRVLPRSPVGPPSPVDLPLDSFPKITLKITFLPHFIPFVRILDDETY